MAEKGCAPSDCEAHKFVVDTVHDLKDVIKEIVSGQHVLEKTVLVLAQNLEEQKRINDRIDKMIVSQSAKDIIQDTEIRENRDFTNKAIGALAVISFGLPVLLSIISYVVSKS